MQSLLTGEEIFCRAAPLRRAVDEVFSFLHCAQWEQLHHVQYYLFGRSLSEENSGVVDMFDITLNYRSHGLFIHAVHPTDHRGLLLKRKS